MIATTAAVATAALYIIQMEPNLPSQGDLRNASLQATFDPMKAPADPASLGYESSPSLSRAQLTDRSFASTVQNADVGLTRTFDTRTVLASIELAMATTPLRR